MARELLWSEDMDFVYGWFKDFKDERDFIREVQNQYEDGECKVTNVIKEHCILTEEGLRGDMVAPIRLTDIEIELFYTASVEGIEVD